MLFAAPRCEIDRARYNRAVGVLAPAGTTDLIGAAVVAALIGGLAAVERKGALQLMLSRPIVLAPLLGWALGDPRGGLVLGVPLELIFLGGVNLGGSLPDNETLLAAALTSAVVPAGIFAGTGVDAPLAALGLALLYPLAVAGPLAIPVPPGGVEPAWHAEPRVRVRDGARAPGLVPGPLGPGARRRAAPGVLQLPSLPRRRHPRGRRPAGGGGGARRRRAAQRLRLQVCPGLSLRGPRRRVLLAGAASRGGAHRRRHRAIPGPVVRGALPRLLRRSAPRRARMALLRGLPPGRRDRRRGVSRASAADHRVPQGIGCDSRGRYRG